MNRIYQQNLRTDNEQPSIKSWLIQKAREIPDLDFSIADSADVEQMSCLLLSILNIYFGLIRLPLKFRSFIFALAGASVGCPKDQNGWFYLRDWQLAIQLMDDEGKTAGALKQRIKRLRDGLEKWQVENRFRLVLLDRGYPDPLKNDLGEVTTSINGEKVAKGIPSRYRLDVLTSALEILRKHQLNPKSLTEVKSMAIELKTRLGGWYLNPDSAGRQDPDKQRARAWSLALSNIKKMVELAREDDEDTVVPLMTLVQEASQRFLLPDDRVDQWLREQVVQHHEEPKC